MGRTRIAQHVEQLADGPHAHRGHPVEAKRPASERDERCYKSRRGTGIANEKIGLVRGNVTARPRDRERLVCFIVCDGNTESRERARENLRIVAREPALEHRVAVGKRSEQERAVRDAFGTRHADVATYRSAYGGDFERRHARDAITPRRHRDTPRARLRSP